MKTRLQPLKEEAYSVATELEDRNLYIKLSGTFDMTAAAPLDAHFTQIEDELKRVQALELIFEVANVYYLGSSCIKGFLKLTAALAKSQRGGLLIRILTSPRLEWQERTFSVLARLAPDMVRVEPMGRASRPG